MKRKKIFINKINFKHRRIQSPNAAIHKIRLQEIIVALHRVYLQPDGAIYNALIQAIIIQFIKSCIK